MTCNLIQNVFVFYSSMSPSQISLPPTPQPSLSVDEQQQSMLTSSSTTPTNVTDGNWRKYQLAETLADFLDECRTSGECFGEYLGLFKTVLNDKDCKYRLVLKGNILNSIESLLHKEIRYLSDLERLSESLPSSKIFFF